MSQHHDPLAQLAQMGFRSAELASAVAALAATLSKSGGKVRAAVLTVMTDTPEGSGMMTICIGRESNVAACGYYMHMGVDRYIGPAQTMATTVSATKKGDGVAFDVTHDKATEEVPENMPGKAPEQDEPLD